MIEKENFNLLKHIKRIFILFLLFIFSCNLQFKSNLEKKDSEKENQLVFKNRLLTNYTGWWIYGEGQHIFKDEKTLKEYDLQFPHENPEEIVALYLAVCEMEYFPMECSINTYDKKDTSEQHNTLIVADFEVLYIQGCGE